MSQDNDPWGKEPKNTGGNDFDALLGQFKEVLFGKKEGGNSSGSSGNRPTRPALSPKIFIGIGGVLFVAWLATGLYIVEEGFNGVELRFGKHSETTQPGWRFRTPSPIGSVSKVDVGSVNTLTVGTKSNTSYNEGQMLTSDENIVEVGLAVQYKIADPEKYLFKVNNPELVLKETMVSSIREVVGANNVDYILTDGRAVWPSSVQENLIATLKGFDVGLDVLRIELRDAKAPPEVQDAFDDAVKAREDAERYKLQAEAYENKEKPLARGQATLITEQAEGYKAEIIAKATGEADRFNNILVSYQKAPEITRDRMYLDSLAKVYGNVSNIIVDTGDNAPMLYLPVGNQNVSQPPPALPLIKEQPNTNTSVAKPTITQPVRIESKRGSLTR